MEADLQHDGLFSPDEMRARFQPLKADLDVERRRLEALENDMDAVGMSLLDRDVYEQRHALSVECIAKLERIIKLT